MSRSEQVEAEIGAEAVDLKTQSLPVLHSQTLSQEKYNTSLSLSLLFLELEGSQYLMNAGQQFYH